MNTTRPRVILDYDILKWLNDYYSYTLTAEKHIEKECFSAPDLELHGCCIYAKLPGDKECDGCKHKAGRLCPITCIIHEFCLAAYAYRLGIGGDDQNKAIAENLKLKYRDLYNKVQEVIGSMNGEESTRIMSVTEIDGKLPPQSIIDKMANTAEEKEKSEMPQVPTEEVVPLVEGVVMEETPEPTPEGNTQLDKELDEQLEQEASDTDPLLTVKEASELWGCTYANICHKIKSGVLMVEMVNNKKKVRKSDILRLKDKADDRRGRKAKS